MVSRESTAIGREAWILGVLLIVFVAATAVYSQRGFETEQRQQPTTYSTGQNGAKALFDLLQRQGVSASRLEKPVSELPEDTGLLVIVEPLARPIDEAEGGILREWLEGGGTLLYVVSANWAARSLYSMDFEEMTVQPTKVAATDIPVNKTASPYLRDVTALHVATSTRLTASPDKKRVEKLAGDASGAVALTWKVGEGCVIAVADGVSVINRSIASADNAVFYINLVQAHAKGDRPAVVFDEYHQGFGLEAGTQKPVWEAIGPPARMMALYLLVAFLLVVYNANRRFGSPRSLDLPSSRPSTEYISSMAALYRRAGAGEIALETIYKDFVRDLTAKTGAPPEAGPDGLAELAGQTVGLDTVGLRNLLRRCEQAIQQNTTAASQPLSVTNRLSETEMLNLARQIQDYRRQAGLVRLS